ncbi:MAG: MATE family efflux transporter, partial [Bacteroidales bacterium]|nr:MATE family efflux transporter [Bacteroidales bacterium]
TVICNILNIFLNWVLIFGHCGFEAMGVKGAAVATFISRAAMLAIGIVILLQGKLYKRYLGDIRLSALNMKQFKEVAKTSFPISFQGLIEVTTFSLAGIMAGWFGEIAMAAHQASQTIITFTFMVAQGVGVAATIRVSHQYGERRFADARMAGFAASHISIALMALSGIAFVVFNDTIPRIFTQDSEVLEIAANLLYVAAAFQLFDAVQLSALASLRALADVRWPLIMSLISYYAVGLPFAYIAGSHLGWGPVGVWLGLLAGLMLAAILYLYRFNKITKGFTTNY